MAIFQSSGFAMKVLVTGSGGHLGEALMRSLRARGDTAIGLDIKPSMFTDHVGSVTDAVLVRRCMAGVDAVLHAATLHKPHVATHARQAFIDTNVSGTLNLLEAAVHANVCAFIFTSTTSAFGAALTPPPEAPAAWITEDVVPVPKNIYGVTKIAAENLCELMHRLERLPCVVLRTSRFFPEDDDSEATRVDFLNANAKANEFLNRRVEIEDVVSAHLLAIDRAPALGFGRYIISATTPFTRDDAVALRHDPVEVVRRLVPGFEAEYQKRGWSLFKSLDRIYDNTKARRELGWQPRWDFAAVIEQLRSTGDFRSALARTVGRKAYHAESFDGQGPYPL